MIAVKLMGGLGNQMFQYAAGRALSVKHNAPLVIDDSFLKADPAGGYTRRALELDQLKTKLRMASPADLRIFDGRSLIDKLLFREASQAHCLKEEEPLNETFFKVLPPVYLDGYWQSEDYFRTVRDVLLEEFRPVNPLSGKALEYSQQIRHRHSIGIHVRRGDYITHAGAAAFHGFPGLSYYTQAVALLQKEVRDCVFFVFSDDLDWCREHLELPGESVFVDSESELACTDLTLMSQCRHNIIANSSYSWWAAWLNHHPDKKVIAPGNWFAGNRSPNGIYCSNWIVL